MKLLSSCPVCNTDQARILPIHLRDDGAADATCPAGHRFIVVSPHDKYEILFESAALALLDEHAREAVADFAAALEEFYGFFVRLVSENRTIDLPHSPWFETVDVDPEEAAKVWQQVAAQSERQIGAFLYLHLLVTGKAYQIDRKSVELRNRVIHRGYLPTLAEASEYGERVWNDITRVVDYLLEEQALGSPTDGEHRPFKIARDQPHVNLVEQPHAIMLAPRDSQPGGFKERLFRLRTTWRGAVYGRGPRGVVSREARSDRKSRKQSKL